MHNCAKRVLKNDLYSFCRNYIQAEVFRLTTRSRHTLCSIAATEFPNAVTPEYAKGTSIESLDSNSNSISGTIRTQLVSSSKFPDLHTNSPAAEYVPYAQKLVEGILALDENRTWNLVHGLVIKGSLSSPECPEFAEFEHVVRLGDFSLAFSALLWKEHYSSSRDAQEIESLVPEAEGFEPSKSSENSRHIPSLDVPPWLSAYMLCTMVRTRAAAVKSFDLCLMLLDTTPKPIAASLLLLSMCSLVRFNVMNQIPALLNAFSDIVIPSSLSEADDSTAVAPQNSSQSSEALIVFQCNVLLNLLSQMPQSVTLGRVATRFLRRMQQAAISLETDTAKKLLDANFATQDMAALITEMLQNQSGSLVGDNHSNFHIALARFYTKRRDLTRALKITEEGTRNHHINKHLKTYLRAFRNTAHALKYVKEINGGESLVGSDKDVLNRPVYVSLLRSAAHCRSISTENFLDMFQMIREQFGDDRRLYTVALIGLIRRYDFEQAKALWNEWVANVDRLGAIINRLHHYLSEREKTYDDAKAVREALDWDKQTESQAKQSLQKLRIDSDALVLGVRAVSGPKPDSLVTAFLLMEKYALKDTTLITSRVVNCFMNRAVSFRRPDIVFKLWDGMKPHYGVSPSLGSLVILMRASRISASMNLSMRSFVPKWLRRKDLRIPSDASLDEGLKLMLHPTYIPDISWHNWEPWRVTRYIFREKIVYRNWPKLKKVAVPALAIRGDSATNAIDALLEAELHIQAICSHVGKSPEE